MEASLGSWEDQKSFQWKDFPTNADDVGAALDLLVQALDGVGGMQLGAVLAREGHVGQHVVFAGVHNATIGDGGAPDVPPGIELLEVPVARAIFLGEVEAQPSPFFITK